MDPREAILCRRDAPIGDSDTRPDPINAPADDTLIRPPKGTSMTTDIEILRHEAVLEVRMNRPQKKNALSRDMYGAMAAGLMDADGDPSIRAVIISGAGDAFTAGNDIADFIAAGSDDTVLEERPVGKFLFALTQLRKPLIAAVQGRAVGVGTTMLFHCDLVYADPSARLTTPFVALGLTPEAASSLLIVQRFGYARAFAMLASGEEMSAQSAFACGLVNEVTADGLARERALQAGAHLAKLPHQAVLETKKLMRGDQEAVRELIRREGVIFGRQGRSEEARDAFMRFFAQKSGA